MRSVVEKAAAAADDQKYSMRQPHYVEAAWKVCVMHAVSPPLYKSTSRKKACLLFDSRNKIPITTIIPLLQYERHLMDFIVLVVKRERQNKWTTCWPLQGLNNITHHTPAKRFTVTTTSKMCKFHLANVKKTNAFPLPWYVYEYMCIYTYESWTVT